MQTLNQRRALAERNREPWVIGKSAPMPKPIARRLSDLNPYAWLDTEEAPGVLDRVIGYVCAIGIVVVLGMLAWGVL